MVSMRTFEALDGSSVHPSGPGMRTGWPVYAVDRGLPMNSWTKADVARLREVMLGQGRGIDEIADEVRVVCNVTRLASYRLAHGLSQPQAVARCRRYAHGGLDQPTLSRLEQFPARGSRTPLAVQLIALATAYGTQPLRLLTPDALERLDPREREVIVRLAAGAVPERESSDQAELGGLSLEGGAALGVPGERQAVGGSDPKSFGHLAGAARRAFRFSSRVEGSNVGPETLAEVEAAVRRLALEYPHQPIGPLVRELAQLQDIGFRLLEGRQRPPQAASLYLLTGIASGMLAKASHDLGDAGSAMTQARAAFVCADNADHDGLRVWVRGLQSLICYWAGWSQDALRYARLGAEPGESGRGSGSVWIASQEARAWGMVGNESATLAALTRAERAGEQVLGDDLDEIGGILEFPHPRQVYYAADALASIPEQHVAAECYAGQAISLYEVLPAGDRGFSDEAGARCDLALARVRLGDAAGAREAIRPVLELAVPLRINGVIASAHRVGAAAAGQAGGRENAGLRAEIRAFCLAPAREIRV
jgi:transcriptional regulator with XRE-family HTH domain